ncbi:MAG: hypothetical protein K2X51_13275 [Burkholderiales bacterium]|nr:hypothetical protein [Burkholderiales bacterium]
MQGISRFILRLVLLAAGLIFALSLLLAACVLLAFWGLRAVWARLTGQPVVPFVMRMDPRSGFTYVFRDRQERPPPTPHEPTGPAARRADLDDVTDVEIKELREPDERRASAPPGDRRE